MSVLLMMTHGNHAPRRYLRSNVDPHRAAALELAGTPDRVDGRLRVDRQTRQLDRGAIFDDLVMPTNSPSFLPFFGDSVIWCSDLVKQ